MSIRMKVRAWWNRVSGETDYIRALVEAETLLPKNTYFRSFSHSDLLAEAVYSIHAQGGPETLLDQATLDLHDYRQQLAPEITK